MAAERPISVLVLALLFLAWGVRALVGVFPSSAGTLDRIPGLALAILTLVTAYGLFQMRLWSLPVYALWVGLVIVVGGVTEFTSGTPLLVIVAWMSLMAAVYVAVGLYLRGVLRQTA